MDNMTRKERNDVRDAGHCAVLVDESKEASQKWQILVVVWYLQPLWENTHEDFFAFRPSRRVRHGLTTRQYQASTQPMLSLCVVQCYDGALPCTLRHYKSSTSFFWVCDAQSFPGKKNELEPTAKRVELKKLWHSLGMPDRQEDSGSVLGYTAWRDQPFKPTLEDRGRSNRRGHWWEVCFVLHSLRGCTTSERLNSCLIR